MCEEYVWILGHTAHLRMLWREGTLAEILDSLPVNQWTQILLINDLNLLILV